MLDVLFVGLLAKHICALRNNREEKLTEDSACRHRLPVQPEGDLRENDGHYAGEIRLDHEIANFPFQMEIRCHHYIFSYIRNEKKRRERP